jgi:uncharacterized membrane protein
MNKRNRILDKLKDKKGENIMMMMGFGLIVPLLLIGIVVYALGAQPQFNQTDPGQTSQTPAETLKARYAGGEITREEYELIRQDLES